MKIGMYSLSSPIHDEEAITATLEQFIKELVEEIDIKEINKDQLKNGSYDLNITFVKTGGTENLFKDIYQDINQPVILLATSLHNSLAAAMEILSWVKSQGGKGRILHGKPSDIANTLKQIITAKNTIKKLKGSRLAVIGKPSDWLIDSDVDQNEINEKWGINLVNIEMQEVVDEFNDINEQQANKLIEGFLNKSEKIVEPTNDDLIKAAKVYYALKNISEKYSLDALTIRCFDLVTKLETTGCLALSFLNNEGIVAGCEGDVPATVSMMIIKYLTGDIPFMANPVSINNKENKVKFAHCTVATDSVDKYVIRSHFETNIGVGIQGEFKKGDITIFKLGSRNLDHVVYKNANLVNNLSSEFACRTQVLVDFNNDNTNYFLENPIGNHHIIVKGDHMKVIDEFVKQLNFNLVNHW